MSTPHSLGRAASFWVAAAVVMHTMWTSAAPAVTYPLYAAQWQLTPATTTAIFAIYPIVIVVVLLFFGTLPDHIGCRKAILMGLAASLTGVLIFAVAPDVTWLFVGRAFMGIGVGLSAAPATAALMEFSAPGESRRAGSIATIATAAGFAAATLIDGGLIQYAPFPTHLNFWMLSVVLAGLFVAAWFLPRSQRSAPATRWHPRIIRIPGDVGAVFVLSALTITASFIHGAMVLSLGAQFERDLIGSSSALLNGATIALFATLGGIVAILAKPLSGRVAIVAGGITSMAGMSLLVLAASQQTLTIFLAGIAVAGAAYGLLMLGGLMLITGHAPAHRRAGLLSAIYLVGFLMSGSVAIAMGVLATAHGLRVAMNFGATVIAMLDAVCIGSVMQTGKLLPGSRVEPGPTADTGHRP